MVKLSIIISYYNTYDLTEKMLNTLIPQLTNEVEVYLTDDGCNEIRLDKYKDYINIIHLPENKGNSTALNTGIKKAIGKYIAFIDSDDMITNDYVETLIDAINNHNEDIIAFDWQDMHNKNIVHKPTNYAPWRNIYKREIIPLFDENIRHSSDVPFREALDEDNKTRYDINKVLYIYNSGRIGSLTWEKEKGDLR